MSVARLSIDAPEQGNQSADVLQSAPELEQFVKETEECEERRELIDVAGSEGGRAQDSEADGKNEEESAEADDEECGEADEEADVKDSEEADEEDDKEAEKEVSEEAEGNGVENDAFGSFKIRLIAEKPLTSEDIVILEAYISSILRRCEQQNRSNWIWSGTNPNAFSYAAISQIIVSVNVVHVLIYITLVGKTASQAAIFDRENELLYLLDDVQLSTKTRVDVNFIAVVESKPVRGILGAFETLPDAEMAAHDLCQGCIGHGGVLKSRVALDMVKYFKGNEAVDCSDFVIEVPRSFEQQLEVNQLHLTLALGTHSRLGAGSPLQKLPVLVLRRIKSFNAIHSKWQSRLDGSVFKISHEKEEISWEEEINWRVRIIPFNATKVQDDGIVSIVLHEYEDGAVHEDISDGVKAVPSSNDESNATVKLLGEREWIKSFNDTSPFHDGVMTEPPEDPCEVFGTMNRKRFGRRIYRSQYYDEIFRSSMIDTDGRLVFFVHFYECPGVGFWQCFWSEGHRIQRSRSVDLLRQVGANTSTLHDKNMLTKVELSPLKLESSEMAALRAENAAFREQLSSLRQENAELTLRMRTSVEIVESEVIEHVQTEAASKRPRQEQSEEQPPPSGLQVVLVAVKEELVTATEKAAAEAGCRRLEDAEDRNGGKLIRKEEVPSTDSMTTDSYIEHAEVESEVEPDIEIGQTSKLSARNLRGSTAKTVVVKFEDRSADGRGFVKCPVCGFGVPAALRGCNTTTCTNHRPFVYFCFYCKKRLHDGIKCDDCPYSIDKESRRSAQMKRNRSSKEQPITPE